MPRPFAANAALRSSNGLTRLLNGTSLSSFLLTCCRLPHRNVSAPHTVDVNSAGKQPWRETADAVGRHLRATVCRARGEQAPRFAAYLAALDQEQIAAATYAGSIGQLERRLPDPDPASGLCPPRAGATAARISV